MPKIYITGEKLAEFSAGTSWTATDDCILTGGLGASYGTTSTLTIDGVLVMQRHSGGQVTDTVGFYIPARKGSVIEMTGAGGVYAYKAI